MDIQRKERHETKFESDERNPISVTYEERSDDTTAFAIRVNGERYMLLDESKARTLHACLSHALEEANPDKK